MTVLYILLVLVLLFLLYVLSLCGRRNHPGMAELKKWNYAHRGLHDESRPENSMAAFRAALEGGFGVELDVHLLADGNLAVLHDSDLQRVTGQSGIIEDLTTRQLKNYHLNGTAETIPEFRQVLELFAGKAPLIVELKTRSRNHAELAGAVCRMLENYSGPYCLESFDPFVIHWLKKNKPDIIRGQLAENTMKAFPEYPWPLRFITSFYLENFLTKPDFIAYKFAHRKTLSNRLCRSLWGIIGVSWTIRTKEEFHAAVQEGWIPIFENFLP